MKKIASFTVNHLDLLPGIYASRKDYVGKEVLTTFDLRMTAPNREPVMNTAEIIWNSSATSFTLSGSMSAIATISIFSGNFFTACA